MGYVFVTSPCVACGQIISYNPHRVPSIRVNGHRQAVCEDCFAKWNQIHRTSKGLEPEIILEGAYDPIPEEELGCQ